MLTPGQGNEPRFLFQCAGLDDAEVYALSGSEGISQLFSFTVQLVSRRRDIRAEDVLDQDALLTIKGKIEDRFVKGVVTTFDVVGHAKERTIYQATLAPPHVRLGLTQRLRIFQDKTTREIVTQVLEDGGVSEGLDWKLKATYTPRNYCVQYRETDLAFILRLLEEDGIAFHFEHTEDELRTVFTDDNSSLEPISGPAALPYCEDRSMVRDREHVSELTAAEQLAIGKVQLRDFRFKQPTVTMEARTQAKTPGPATGEYYDYPAEFVDAGLGERLAKVRLESLQSGKQLGYGASDCTRLVAGRKLALEEHPRQDLNQEHLLVLVSCHGTQPHVMGEEGAGGDVSYGNTFTVMPANTTYRPPRLTPRPVVLGPCSATVVGPKGEEIYVDEHGRVKVQFHWDREGQQNERSSCWIRASHPWAGAAWGAVFLPRVGHEVVVMFLEGDPDRPVIVGRVYNGQNAHPHELPASKTVSTIKSSSSPGGDGFNELRFEDRKGAEEVFVHAQRDYNLVVLNDRTSRVGHDRSEQVGNDQTEQIGHDCKVHVANRSEHRAKTILIEAEEKITLKVGKSFIEITEDKIRTFSRGAIKSASVGVTKIDGGLVKINCGK